ncbi:hypothetical protein R1T40_19205 [Tritonibacter scottomollicae]|uniref:Lipoprotein n=1 Tax=Tritonibacter scottomollicae TaxID=483013 RepID=A0ABZ0HEY6_TRISK|nr:hypothetical protein [Tritonibacter scottomollicae]WOI33042.1 hypothetical protein R1T40_19205 [Tritonibacter scottomollicae]
MIRTLALLALTVLVAACTPPTPDDELRDLGRFKLGHNIVVAPKVQMVPGSRKVEPDEWVDVLTNEMAARFSRYEGDQLYHFGLSVEGYFVAPGGVPLVLSPKSVLAIKVTVWDDAANKKLNAEPETFTVFETTSGESFLLGSGHTRTRDEQMLGLARNAVKEIEIWMAENHAEDRWFAAEGEVAPAPVKKPVQSWNSPSTASE